MQIHIALYHWNDGTTQEQIEHALGEIAALEEKVDGIVEISCARNESQYAEGYTHVILVRGRDAEALAAYRAHPDHDVAARLIEAMEERGIGVDFSTSRDT